MRPLKRLKPMHWEIIRRLVLGATQREIARDMGLNEARLSIIVNSPLFQIELKKAQKRRDEQLAEELSGRIYKKLAETTERAIDVHSEILEKEALPLQIRQRSATDVINLYIKTTKGSPLSAEEDIEPPYERRLREFVYRETEVRKMNQEEPPLDLNYLLDEEEKEALEEEAEEQERRIVN